MSEQTFDLTLRTIVAGKAELDQLINAEQKRMQVTEQVNEGLRKREPILQHLLADENKLAQAADAGAQKQEKLSADTAKALDALRTKMQETRAALPAMSDEAFKTVMAPLEAQLKEEFARVEAAQKALLQSMPDWAKQSLHNQATEAQQRHASNLASADPFLSGLHSTGSDWAERRRKELEEENVPGSGSLRDQAQGILGARKSTKMIDRLMGLGSNPEMMAKMGIEESLSAMGASLPTIIAGVGALATVWKVVKTGLGEVVDETPHLKEEVGNLGDAMKQRLGDVAKGVLGGSGDGLLSLVRAATTAVGGMTEEDKRALGPIQGYVALSERRKNIVEQLAIAEHKAAVESAAHMQAIGELAAQLEHLQNSSFDDEMESARLDHLEVLKQINEDTVQSEETRALRIADANAALLAKEIEVSQKRRALKIQEKAWALEEKKDQFLDASSNVDAIEAQIQAVSKLAAARAKDDNAAQNARRANALIEGRGDEVSLPAFGPGGVGSKIKDETFERDRLQAQKAQAYANKTKAELEEAQKAIKPDSETNKEKLEEAHEKAKAKQKSEAEELQKQQAEFERSQADEKRKQESEAEIQKRKLQQDQDKATGTGREGALNNGRNADEQKDWEERQNNLQHAGKGHATSSPSSTATPSTTSATQSSAGTSNVSTMQVGTLHVQNATNLGGGSGGGSDGGSGGGHGSSGGAVSAPGAHGNHNTGNHKNAGSDDVRGKLTKWAQDKLVYDIAMAERMPDKSKEAQALNKSWFDHQFRLQHLDDAIATHAGDDNGAGVSARSHAKHAHQNSSGMQAAMDAGVFGTAPGAGASNGSAVGKSGAHYNESEADDANAKAREHGDLIRERDGKKRIARFKSHQFVPGEAVENNTTNGGQDDQSNKSPGQLAADMGKAFADRFTAHMPGNDFWRQFEGIAGTLHKQTTHLSQATEHHTNLLEASAQTFQQMHQQMRVLGNGAVKAAGAAVFNKAHFAGELS